MKRTKRTRNGIDRRQDMHRAAAWLVIHKHKDRRASERRVLRDLESPEDYAELDRVLDRLSLRR